MRARYKYLLFTVVCFQILLSACQAGVPTQKAKELLSRTNFMMGTVCNIRLFDSQDETILDKAFARIAEIEARVSSNEEGTEIDLINQNAGIQKVHVSDDSIAAIQKGIEFAELSDGSFDISIGTLVKLWNIGFDDARVPEQWEIDEVLPLINYKNIEVNAEENTVFLKKEGMRLDLGAVAKGYAADEVAKVLRENGVESAIIDLGGNLLTVGNNVNSNEPWVIGVQNPFDKRGTYIGTIRYSDKSFVTSGMYERYFEQDGVRYHHLLNPHTGYPFKNDIAGVTIISDESVDGDCLSTVTFSKDVTGGLDLIESLQNVEAVFVTFNRDVYISSGLKGNFRLSNTNYTLKN